MKNSKRLVICLALWSVPADALEVRYTQGAWQMVCEPGIAASRDRCSLVPAADGPAGGTDHIQGGLRMRFSADGSDIAGHIERPARTCGEPAHEDDSLEIGFVSPFGDTIRTIRAHPGRLGGFTFDLRRTGGVSAIPFSGQLELSYVVRESPSTTVIRRTRIEMRGFREASAQLLSLPKGR